MMIFTTNRKPLSLLAYGKNFSLYLCLALVFTNTIYGVTCCGIGHSLTGGNSVALLLDYFLVKSMKFIAKILLDGANTDCVFYSVLFSNWNG